MINAKLAVRPLIRRALESIVRPTLLVQLLYEFVVGPPLYDALLVQHRKYPHVFHIDQVQLCSRGEGDRISKMKKRRRETYMCEILWAGGSKKKRRLARTRPLVAFDRWNTHDVLIVGKADEFPQDALAFVLLSRKRERRRRHVGEEECEYVCCCVGATTARRKNHLLLHLKYVLVEMLLQRFVRVIDTKLFERVGLECLETENVQDANVRGRILLSSGPRQSIMLLGAYASINRLDDVIEVGAVHRLHEPLGRLIRLLGFEFLGDVPLLQDQHARREGCGEVLERHPEEFGNGEGCSIPV
jgi:hypothetical protein